jgi:hypothetical protein
LVFNPISKQNGPQSSQRNGQHLIIGLAGRKLLERDGRR